MSSSSMYAALERGVVHRLAETTGRAVDTAYAALVHQLGLTPRFFAEGIGDLAVVDFHADVQSFSRWPPEHFEHVDIQWQKERTGVVAGAGFSVYRGKFQTPCPQRVYDALPAQSRTAHVQWIVPDVAAPGAPTVVQLAATGDHGYARRTHLSVPLVTAGIGSMALESPYYGQRKPPQQSGAKLRRVSDLLLLGRATIEESLLLLDWLSRREHRFLGMSGLSMGGVHATMVAGLYPSPMALTPLLAPRSAAAAYCQGALYHATDWKQLKRDWEQREREIAQAVEAAAKGNQKLAAARLPKYLRKDTELPSSQQPGQVSLQPSSDAVSFEATATSSDISSGSNEAQSAAQTAGQWAMVRRWASAYSSALESQLRRVRQLSESTRRGDGGADQEAAVALVEAVLETFTDVTRFPVPCRPDAAVLVAATEDAYVSRKSVLEVHRHLPGSEVVWVPGGHVSSFLLHHDAFRRAIQRSLEKLQLDEENTKETPGFREIAT